MTPSAPTLYYDFIDPLSWLMAGECARLNEPSGSVRHLPFELRPPPTPLTTVQDSTLSERWRIARTMAEKLDVRFRPAPLVPWTRKAHELVLYGATEGVATLRMRLFEAYLFEGRDIGRVDVLVDLGREAGLDRTATKAALDVDRFQEELVALRLEALDRGIRTVPSLRLDDRALEGFHNRAAVRTFLGT
jgi:predicted DsbA family dithiol-disulfide isomerase